MNQINKEKSILVYRKFKPYGMYKLLWRNMLDQVSVFAYNVSSWYRHQNHANNVSSCIIWRCVEKYKENEVLETYLSYKQLTLQIMDSWGICNRSNSKNSCYKVWSGNDYNSFAKTASIT